MTGGRGRSGGLGKIGLARRSRSLLRPGDPATMPPAPAPTTGKPLRRGSRIGTIGRHAATGMPPEPVTREEHAMAEDSQVTDALRAKVREELREVEEIRDAELREKVVEVWALAIARSSFTSIGDIAPSGNPGVMTLKRGTQVDHLRGVARLAMGMADDLTANFPELEIDRDLVIAGALCHDVGKPWEFDPENRKRWESRPRAAGLPSVRHPAYGAHLCFTVGLPEEVAHCATGSLRRGRAPRSQPREHDRPPRRPCVLEHHARRGHDRPGERPGPQARGLGRAHRDGPGYAPVSGEVRRSGRPTPAPSVDTPGFRGRTRRRLRRGSRSRPGRRRPAPPSAFRRYCP